MGWTRLLMAVIAVESLATNAMRCRLQWRGGPDADHPETASRYANAAEAARLERTPINIETWERACWLTRSAALAASNAPGGPGMPAKDPVRRAGNRMPDIDETGAPMCTLPQ